MTNETDSNNILNSLDGLQKASPGDFFFTRVQARLHREEISAWGRVAAFLTRPVVALSTLSVIILLNAGALVYRHAEVKSGALAQQQAETADEYNTTVAMTSYYNENPDPR